MLAPLCLSSFNKRGVFFKAFEVSSQICFLFAADPDQEQLTGRVFFTCKDLKLRCFSLLNSRLVFNVVLFQGGLVKRPFFVFLTVSYQEVVMKQMLVCFPLQLLTVNPEHRFSSLSDMQTSAYLADVDWDGVHEKKMEPGFVPNVSVTTLQPSASCSIGTDTGTGES